MSAKRVVCWTGEAPVSPLAERQTRQAASLREISWLPGDRDRLGGVASPVGDLFQTFSRGMLEESDFVASVFEFVDVGPALRLPRRLVSLGLAATGAAGVEGDAWLWRSLHVLQFVIVQFEILQFEKAAAHFFDLF